MLNTNSATPFQCPTYLSPRHDARRNKRSTGLQALLAAQDGHEQTHIFTCSPGSHELEHRPPLSSEDLHEQVC